MAKSQRLSKFTNDEWDKDIWDLQILCNPGDSYQVKTHAVRILNFTKISQTWLRSAAKQFVKYCISTLSLGTAVHRYKALVHFSTFLNKKYPGIQPCNISRSLIVDYLSSIRKYKASTRCGRLSHLKAFLEITHREKWLDIESPCRLIYREDFPHRIRSLPKYIPDSVVKQLIDNLDYLPPNMAALTLIQLECGRRGSEICHLEIDCLAQDDNGHNYIRYFQHKVRREHTIPISDEVAAVIRQQQQMTRKYYGKNAKYLFPGFDRASLSKKTGNPISRVSFHKALNKLAEERGICDESGKVWHFSTHQFRHTVGTQMINSGVPQHIVQRFLGHASPTMTMVYAHIHDETLRKELEKFHESRVVNFQGDSVELENTVLSSNDDLEWFKKNVQARALEHGYCARPRMLGDCDIPGFDGCYNCPHWRTNKNFLSVLKDTLARTNNVLNKAHKCGWELQILKNQPIKENLEKVIRSLEEE